MGGNIDENCLIVRNFPASYTEKDIYDFLQMFDANRVQVFVAQRTAVIDFNSKDHARDILTLLHQEALDDNRLFVEYAPKNHSHIVQFDADAQSNSDHADDTDINIVDALKRFYALAENLNIHQPPPPQLRYEYPKCNRDIVDAIGIALECVPKFYVQVLHLMNRMNLEPPFMPGSKNLVYESAAAKVQHAVASTQTDDIMWQQSVRSKRKLIESDESELDSQSSDECDDDNGKADHYHPLISKRAKLNQNDDLKNLPKQELIKQKQQNLLKMQRKQKQLECTDKPTSVQSNQNNQINDAFDSSQFKSSTSIKIVVPENLDRKRNTENESVTTISSQANDNINSTTTAPSRLWSDAELSENRIPTDQLKVYPVFQNYSPGDISNRLYVKNIAKDVTESDLHAIYDRYLDVNCEGAGDVRCIDIRLMTSGRMKGQAFINFTGPYLNCDVDNQVKTNLEHKYRIITKALRETNGLIVKGKPIVVVYGKNK